MKKLIRNAENFTNRTAIISNEKAYRYQQLLDVSASIATSLLDEHEDLQEARIAFMVDPSFEYTACQWGIWRAGGIAVPLCTLHPIESISYVLEDSEVSTLLVSKDYHEFLSPLAEKLDLSLTLVEESLSKEVKSLPDIDAARRAMILYTSGTTNLPKGVVTTHENIAFQIETLVNAWSWSKEDHILNTLPLHHVHGIINVMSCALWSGAICEFLPAFDAAKVWKKFEAGSLSLYMAVPTIYYKLIKYWKEQTEEKKQALSSACTSFRLMVSGSAALPIPVLEEWESITGVRLLERYGMTEIGMALSNPYGAERRPGHVGQPLLGVQIRLQKEDGRLAQGSEPGEIQIKGPNVFLEYWQKPTATQESFTQDGWFKSGDVAVLTDGYYQILGRNSVDIIKSGGYKISALEIESKLLEHPQIEQCGIVGIPDLEWGEIVSAAVVSTDSSLKESEITEWLRPKMPSYKLPRKYIFIEDLPKNTLGKVTKNKLKEYF